MEDYVVYVWALTDFPFFLNFQILFIYLFDRNLIPPPRGRHATTPRRETRRKERRKKGLGQRAKPSAPTQGIDARMGEKEQNRKQKEKQKKETVSGPPTKLPGPFCRLLRPAWIIRWAYSEIPPSPQGEMFI